MGRRLSTPFYLGFIFVSFSYTEPQNGGRFSKILDLILIFNHICMHPMRFLIFQVMRFFLILLPIMTDMKNRRAQSKGSENGLASFYMR